MWMGGNVPLGYDVSKRKLVINAREAETVRNIFRRYSELGSVSLLRADLDRRGIVSNRRDGAGGKLTGGQRFSRGALYTLLRNRIYRGEIAHHGHVYPGQHDAVVDEELWQTVRDKLAANRHERTLAVGAEASSLLAGLIVDHDGQRMTLTHAVKKGKRYRYYVSTPLISGGRSGNVKGRRIPAGDIEGLVLDRLRTFFTSEAEVSDALAPLGLDAVTHRAVLDRSAELAKDWTTRPSPEIRTLVKSVVQQVQVRDADISVWLNRMGIVSTLLPGSAFKPTICNAANEPAVLSIVASLRRAGKGVRLVIGDGTANKIDNGLATLIARAIATRNMLLAGRDDSIDGMASRLGVRRDSLTVLVRLSYLSPEIVRAILAGQQPVGLSPTRLAEMTKDLPCDWQDQRRHLGFAAA